MIVQNNKMNTARKKIRTHLNTTQKSALFFHINPAFLLFWEIFILFSSTAFQKHWKKLLVGHNLCLFQNFRACWLWVKNRENFFLFLCCTSVNTYPLQFSLHVPLSLKFTSPISRMDQAELMCWSAVHSDSSRTGFFRLCNIFFPSTNGLCILEATLFSFSKVSL